MTILVATETVLLVLLALVVVALLRSHAEILRRLGPPEEDEVVEAAHHGVLAPGVPAPPEHRGIAQAHDIRGVSLAGDAVQVGFGGGGRPALLAFLSSGCTTCQAFWEAFAAADELAIPGGARLVVITKDTTHESPSRLRELAAPGLDVVMSSTAWTEYAVPTSPYFVYVDAGMIQGEGAASSWPQVASLLRDAIDDARAAAPHPRLRVSRASGAQRARRVDDELAAAGIGPDHPSLYPGGRDPSPGAP